MIESGIIKELDGENAVVFFKRNAMCENCGGCMMSADSAEVYLTLENTLGASVGDRVEVAIGRGRVFLASLIAYGAPLIALTIGVIVGYNINIGIARDVFAAICGIALATAALFSLKLVDGRMRRSRGFTPRMLKII